MPGYFIEDLVMTDNSRSIIRLFGPFLPFVQLTASLVITLTLSRGLLTFWQAERLAGAEQFALVMFNGLRVDLILSGMLLLPMLLLAPVLAHRFAWPLWTGFVKVWMVIAIVVVVFMELATPTFIIEYGLRPNRLFIEYLKYPQEIMAMLWEGYRLTLIGGIGLTLIFGYAMSRLTQRFLAHYRPDWPYWKTLLCWPLVALVLVLMIRSTLGHRPANPSMFAVTPDPLVNDLMLNSAWSVYFAIYNLKHEDKSNEVYGDLSHEQILAAIGRGRPQLSLDAKGAPPIVNRQHATQTYTRPRNLVIILEESLSASFVKSLGGRDLAPELDKLGRQGWWFENLYATGTRSVRGIEAVISGFLPTRSRSVVKLSLAQHHFFTLAELLAQKGYLTEFLYGGQAHFDNMASFFMGNGFQQITDREHFDDPVFEGSWGASDEDLFNKLDQRLQQHHASGQPFFSFAFTSSNHSPYEFPDGRIEIEGDKHTPENAVRYADYALGQFFDKARQSDYWQDTVFLVVADHNNRVEGDNLVPIDKYHIPGLLLGAGIEPKRVKTVASQIDLPTTVLSLMGVSASHPMIGRDLTQASELSSPGRAFMQYDDYFARMTGNEVVILRPQAEPVSATYDPKQKKLSPGKTLQAEQVEETLAHALLPGWLYRCQCYRPPQIETDSDIQALVVKPEHDPMASAAGS